jgi:hypothetical protein
MLAAGQTLCCHWPPWGRRNGHVWESDWLFFVDMGAFVKMQSISMAGSRNDVPDVQQKLAESSLTQSCWRAEAEGSVKVKVLTRTPAKMTATHACFRAFPGRRPSSTSLPPATTYFTHRLPLPLCHHIRFFTPFRHLGGFPPTCAVA